MVSGAFSNLPRLNSTQNPNYNSLDNDRGAQLGAEEASIGSSYLQSSSQVTLFSKFDPRVMSDIIIGLSDGLTVPFALTAGLSLLGNTKLVITSGLAELVLGAILMGLGGYLAAKSESQYYHSEVSKEKRLFFSDQSEIQYELADVLADIGISDETAVNLFIDELQKDPTKMVNFIIRYGKGLEEPADGRQMTSALTIGILYFLGGFVPLIPYFFANNVGTGLAVSCFVMALTLFVFGYVKTIISIGADCSTSQKVSEGGQMLAVGGLAAACAWLLVRLIED